MQTSDAVLGRRSIRGYLDRPVELDLLTDVFEAARRAPSSGNLQPWHIYVLTGDALNQVTKRVAEQVRNGGPEADPQFPSYPADLASPYRDRKFRNGELFYSTLGVDRDDQAGRLEQLTRNYEFFGAPVGLFLYVHRQMGSAQWSDLGMFLQTVMLLLHDRGVGTCAQVAWASYHREIAEILEPPIEHLLFCGMSIGYEDPDVAVNKMHTERAPLADVASFLGWDQTRDLG